MYAQNFGVSLQYFKVPIFFITVEILRNFFLKIYCSITDLISTTTVGNQVPSTSVLDPLPSKPVLSNPTT